MKFIFLCALFISTSAFARQYIQCGIADYSSTNVMVINLQDTGKQSTLFLSSGMQNPENERLLVKIDFDKIQGKNSIFKITDEQGTGSIIIPTQAIGQSSDHLNVKLIFASYSYDYSCFSRIYND